MGCRCKERGQALSTAVTSLARGQVAGVGRQLGFVGRTLVQDARSGALRDAAAARLAQLRRTVRPR
jgi:hypothetical protein